MVNNKWLNGKWCYLLLLAGMAGLSVYVFCLPKRLFDVPYSTVVSDRNGELLGARIADDGQWRFPPCDTVPQRYAICLTEFEDRYFRYHWGVNPLAIGRALMQNMKAGQVVSGGSTLTMQIVRLARNKERTFGEKIIEALLATRLEFRYSKDELLALYASHAPFGGNVVGLYAASWRYFGRPPDRLSWAETATLAVLPNAPALLHLSRNRPALLDKRNRLLQRLFDAGKINATTYELALCEPLPDEPLPLPQIAPHLVEYFQHTHRGEQCVSTVDKNLQQRVERLLERHHRELAREGIRNLSAIVIDIPAGEVSAYCGNVGFNEGRHGNQVDVLRAERSTGSLLKPFLLEAMLQEGELLPRTLLPDIPMNLNGFSPQNFNHQYEGAVPASEAVTRSLNIPLVYMLRRYGVAKFHDYLQRNHIATLPRNPSHYGLSLILGGAEANLSDLTNAYANMARCLQGLPGVNAALLLHTPADTVATDFQAGAVWQVFEALKEVGRPEGLDWEGIPGTQTVAWKTGTSYGSRDAWAIGVTPRYAVGIWAGNASGESSPNLTGVRTAGPVLFDIFGILPASGWFRRPEQAFVEAEVCRQSGHLKGRFCEETDTVLLLPNGLRTAACPFHVPVQLTPDERFRVNAECAAHEPAVSKSWFTLPPAWDWYYKQHHPGYRSLPPFMPGCCGNTSRPMQFIYPQGHTHIYLPKQLDGSRGEVHFELAHTNPHAEVFWHVDQEFAGSTTDFHTLSVRLNPGQHSITVVDNDGNMLSIEVSASEVRSEE